MGTLCIPGDTGGKQIELLAEVLSLIFVEHKLGTYLVVFLEGI